MKIAICDDDPYMARELWGRLTLYCRERGLSPCRMECFSSGSLLLKSGCDFDLVFLDIQMQQPDGMETARRLRRMGKGCLLVFVTVLEECVFDAFAVEAFDYLLKPLDNDRFARTMDRALHTLAKGAAKDLLIRHGASSTVVPLGHILFCEVQGRSLFIHRTDEPPLECRGRLEALAQRLDERFFRCHRSYLVNLDHVRGVRAGRVLLPQGGDIPVSRLRERDLAQALLRRMRGREL